MLVSTVSLGKNYVQLYLLSYILLPYMKAEPITVLCTGVQIMEQWSYTRGPSLHYIELDQVSEELKFFIVPPI